MIKLNHWEQVLGLTIDDAFSTKNGAIALYFDEAQSLIEVESTNSNLTTGFQSVDSSTEEPCWIQGERLKGKIIEGVIVPFIYPGRSIDARIRILLEGGEDFFISSEIERVPLRIT